jgi:REase_DpnII-MboI
MPSRADEINELREHYRRGDDLIAVHYACENLYAVEDHPAAVSCIGYSPIGPGNAVSFSIVDAQEGVTPRDAEIGVLAQYFEYLQYHSAASFVHWNMSKADYGFAALEARYRHLTGEVPYHLPSDRTYDLDDLVADEFGPDYVAHPRMSRLATANGLTRRHALGGQDEAERFASGDDGSVRRSTDEKVRWIAALAERFLGGTLKTGRSVGSVTFAQGHLDAVRTLVAIGERFLYVERELRRRHQDRATLVVNDEYDAQDLFRSLLKLFFEDVRPEDYVPSYAGSSSRVDFLLPEFQLAVELKHARDTMTSASLGVELLVDVGRYSAREDIRHLVCLVFDHTGRLENPRGLERDLSNEVSNESIAVTVVIVDR